jgi:hypothetical protein
MEEEKKTELVPPPEHPLVIAAKKHQVQVVCDEAHTADGDHAHDHAHEKEERKIVPEVRWHGDCPTRPAHTPSALRLSNRLCLMFTRALAGDLGAGS